MEKSASIQTHLVGLGTLNRKAPTTTADPSQLPRIVKLSIGPRFGSDHQLRPDSDDTRLHPGKNMLLSVANNLTGEEKLGQRICQNFVLSCLDYCNSVLANLPEVTLAPLIRVQHSANSKSPEIGFCIGGNDGAPLAPTPSSNNIQIVYIDARHPPWSKHMKEVVLPVSTLPGLERLLSAATTTTSVALNSNLVSAHSLWPPQSMELPTRFS